MNHWIGARRLILSAMFIPIVVLGFVETNESLSVLPTIHALVVGPINFAEIHFVAGPKLESRSPRMGEEFIVRTRIRNVGPSAIYYLPTLCDSSLSAVFDPFFVRVESGRPRCLAASRVTPLGTGEETVVWAPESGTAYVAILPGFTTVTVIFTYNTDPSMDPSTQAEARSTVPLTIEGLGGLSIPGFPIESLVLGVILAFGLFLCKKRIRTT